MQTDTYTERVPITDASGKPIQDEHGNMQYRWVGPGDCMRGSKATVVFQMSKLYVAASFGPINAIREVYIKPAPPRERGVLGGAKIVQVVDPLQAARALQALMNSEEPEEEEAEEAPKVDPVTEEAIESERVSGSDKKRKARESGDESVQPKKSSKKKEKAALSELPENDL